MVAVSDKLTATITNDFSFTVVNKRFDRQLVDFNNVLKLISIRLRYYDMTTLPFPSFHLK
jgi:hypothetical protein